jgi:hypothetical protein
MRWKTELRYALHPVQHVVRVGVARDDVRTGGAHHLHEALFG